MADTARARVFMSGRSQHVTIPENFGFVLRRSRSAAIPRAAM